MRFVPDGDEDSPAQERTGFALWSAALRWQRELTAALAPSSLTPVQYALLSTALAYDRRHRRPPSQVVLAQAAGTDTMMTSQVLRALEQRGLIVRGVDPTDRRARRIVLTAAGTDVVAVATPLVDALEERHFGPDGDGTADLRRVLETLRDAA